MSSSSCIKRHLNFKTTSPSAASPPAVWPFKFSSSCSLSFSPLLLGRLPHSLTHSLSGQLKNRAESSSSPVFSFRRRTSPESSKNIPPVANRLRIAIFTIQFRTATFFCTVLQSNKWEQHHQTKSIHPSIGLSFSLWSKPTTHSFRIAELPATRHPLLHLFAFYLLHFHSLLNQPASQVADCLSVGSSGKGETTISSSLSCRDPIFRDTLNSTQWPGRCDCEGW